MIQYSQSYSFLAPPKKNGVVHMFLYKNICSCICLYLHVSDCMF